MTDFPNGVNSPGAASYVAPLLDFSPIGNLPQDVFQGQQNRLKTESQRAFRNGIPKTPDGQNDYKAMTEKMIQIGDYGTASTIGQLGYQQGALEQLGTNPEIVGYGNGKQPAGGVPGRGSPSQGQPESSPPPSTRTAQQPYDTRPARPDNNGGFSPPAASSEPEASSAPTTGQTLAPNVKAEIDRRNQGDFDTRKRNLGRLMASPFPGIKDYAGKLLEALLKEQESTPDEKNRRSGTTQYGADVKVNADNRTLTPEMKNVQPGSGPNGQSAAGAAEEIKLGGANRTLTPEQKNVVGGPAGAPSAAETAEDIKVRGANRTLTPTAKDTQPREGESPAEAASRIKVRGDLDTKAGEAGVKQFDTEYNGLQKLGQSSFNGIQKAELAKNLTMQPGYYSGPLQRTTEMYQQFKSTFGSDPTTALPQEAFQKVTTDMLTEQIKALGQSGVGRVLLAEVQNMQKGLASLGISPAGNRAQLEIVTRVYKESQDLAKIAREIASDFRIPPEAKARVLDERSSQYFQEHPIFNEQEKRDPRILSAPDVPPRLNTPAAVRAWAKAVGLSPGNLVKWNGQIGAVP